MKFKAGDGGDGGGIALGSKQWEKEALSIAEELSEKSFDGDLKIYAFKTSPKLIVYIRIEKLSSKYVSFLCLKSLPIIYFLKEN